MEQSKNATAELFYNTRPVFFSHNSIDQIHPLDLDRYFTWNKLPKVSLNWINQTEATINLSIDAITQFKLTNWFHFGDVYFNVMSYKMISQTGNNKVYQYHLKMNIHNTFLPKVFRELQSTNLQQYLVQVNRTNMINITSRFGYTYFSKIDPMLNFANKNYTLIATMPDLISMNPMKLSGGTRQTPTSNSFPTINWNDMNYCYFTWENNDNGSAGINKNIEQRYSCIKWYVWKNPSTKSLIFVPSLNKAHQRVVVNVITAVDALQGQQNLANLINVETGKNKASRVYQHHCYNNDDNIEEYLLNNSTNNTAFGNQENFVGAFFGPAITQGDGVWVLFRPNNLNTLNEAVEINMDNQPRNPFFNTFIAYIPNNNLSINNDSGINRQEYYANMRIAAEDPWVFDTVSGVNVLLTSHSVNNTFVSNDNVNSTYILRNAMFNAYQYQIIKPIDNQKYGTWYFNRIQFSNVFSIHALTATTPFGPLSYEYPQTIPVITDTYQQYLNSVRNQQDTSIGIAKQQMEINIAQHTVNGVIGTARGVATAATNWFNPSKIASGSFDAAQAISDTAFGITREIVGYENKQKEIDAANMDKQNSMGATMHSSNEAAMLQNMLLGHTDVRSWCYVFNKTKPAQTYHKIHDMYWTSILVKLPNSASDFIQYHNYLFWNGIYLDYKVRLSTLVNVFNNTAKPACGFVYIDMVIDDYLLNSIYPSINMDYKMMIRTIFNNGLRLYVNGATPTNLLAQSYEPLIVSN